MSTVPKDRTKEIPTLEQIIRLMADNLFDVEIGEWLIQGASYDSKSGQIDGSFVGLDGEGYTFEIDLAGTGSIDKVVEGS